MNTRTWLWPVRIILIAALLVALFTTHTDTIFIGGTEQARAFAYPTFTHTFRLTTLSAGPLGGNAFYKITQHATVKVTYPDPPGKSFPQLPVSTQVTDISCPITAGIGWDVNWTWCGSTKKDANTRDFGFNWTERFLGIRTDCWARVLIDFQAASPEGPYLIRKGDVRQGCG